MGVEWKPKSNNEKVDNKSETKKKKRNSSGRMSGNFRSALRRSLSQTRRKNNSKKKSLDSSASENKKRVSRKSISVKKDKENAVPSKQNVSVEENTSKLNSTESLAESAFEKRTDSKQEDVLTKQEDVFTKFETSSDTDDVCFTAKIPKTIRSASGNQKKSGSQRKHERSLIILSPPPLFKDMPKLPTSLISSPPKTLINIFNPNPSSSKSSNGSRKDFDNKNTVQLVKRNTNINKSSKSSQSKRKNESPLANTKNKSARLEDVLVVKIEEPTLEDISDAEKSPTLLSPKNMLGTSCIVGYSQELSSNLSERQFKMDDILHTPKRDENGAEVLHDLTQDLYSAAVEKPLVTEFSQSEALFSETVDFGDSFMLNTQMNNALNKRRSSIKNSVQNNDSLSMSLFVDSFGQSQFVQNTSQTQEFDTTNNLNEAIGSQEHICSDIDMSDVMGEFITNYKTQSTERKNTRSITRAETSNTVFGISFSDADSSLNISSNLNESAVKYPSKEVQQPPPNTDEDLCNLVLSSTPQDSQNDFGDSMTLSMVSKVLDPELSDSFQSPPPSSIRNQDITDLSPEMQSIMNRMCDASPMSTKRVPTGNKKKIIESAERSRRYNTKVIW